MKNRISRILFLALSLALLLAMSTAIVFAQSGADPASTAFFAPPLVSYQGRITVDGQPYDGAGYFKFAVVDSAGAVVWSNDMPVAAQSATQDEPFSAIELPVVNGLFNVLLGDPALGMPFLEAPVFYDPFSTLRVWFSSNPGGPFTQLPDRTFATTPYAFLADEADTLGGFRANDFAPVAHNHWGETWSGSGTGLELNSSDSWGLDVSTGSSSQYATAIRGKADANSGETVGVWGANESGSDGAMGVWGQVGGPGQTVGVFGQNTSDHTAATGVLGHAQASSGLTYGVVGKSDSQQGIGVRGVGHAPSGDRPSIAVGLWGDTDTGIAVLGYTASSQNNMAGVAGSASSATGKVHGVSGQTSSSQGYGVYGKNVGGGTGVFGKGEKSGVHGWGNGSGVTYGVVGETGSMEGAGVYGIATITGTVGIATAASGVSVGVYGEASSLSGKGVLGEGGYYGIYGVGTDPSGLSHGVHGETASTKNGSSGVHGVATAGSGVTYGVYGRSDSPAGYGVYSEGNAHINGDLTWKAKTGYVSVAAAAFQPNDNTIAFQNDGYELVPKDSNLELRPFFAPVSLPHNAQLKSLVVRVCALRPGVTADDFEFRLLRMDINAGFGDSPTEMALVPVSEIPSGACQSFTTITFSHATVDNSRYIYYLGAWIQDFYDTIALRGAIIEYEITQP
ncbi:MAG TPA: hypothetical protein G4N94_11515 [Caldilineae bacterium]|nr:hypothetical protein [Caldilineae bacterium]